MYCHDAAQCVFCTAAAFPNAADTAYNSRKCIAAMPTEPVLVLCSSSSGVATIQGSSAGAFDENMTNWLMNAGLAMNGIKTNRKRL